MRKSSATARAIGFGDERWARDRKRRDGTNETKTGIIEFNCP
jgi:hypothetical protein